MSPQAVAGMIRNINMSKRASNQNALRGSSIAALDVCDMCEAIIKTPSPVKQIPIR
jgi:molybdenum cofactor biosynthesis enzyme